MNLQKIFLILLLIVAVVLVNAPLAYAVNLQKRIEQYPQWQDKLSLAKPHEDLIFPNWFAGTWQVTNILKEQIAPLAPKFKTPGFEQNFAYIDQEIKFKIRFTPKKVIPQISGFIPKNIDQKSEKFIIADRTFNGLNIARAYLGEENVISVNINDYNSTEQITKFRGENELISTVIGREKQTVSEKEFITSEITRQFFRRPESIYLNLVETTTKYKLIDSNHIEGEQITAIYLSPEDPDFFLAINKPVALYYYVLILDKEIFSKIK